MSYMINPETAKTAMWNALYALEDKQEKQFGPDYILENRPFTQSGFEAALQAIVNLPPIEVVPLDVVCKMLAEQFDCPCNFSPIDEEMAYRCQDDCRMDDDRECWKRVILAYMEKEDEKP